MSQSVQVDMEPVADTVSTILSDQVMIPIHCEQCGESTSMSLKQLKERQPAICDHCYSVMQLTDLEVEIMRQVLAQAGFHFSR